MGCKLGYRTLHFALYVRDLLDATPIVGFHREIRTCLHAQPDPQPVAYEDIQNPVVPPALCKVGQLVLQRVFHHFKHDRYNPAKPVVAENQGLGVPAQHMSSNENVKLLVYGRPFETTVISIGAFRQADPKGGIEIL